MSNNSAVGSNAIAAYRNQTFPVVTYFREANMDVEPELSSSQTVELQPGAATDGAAMLQCCLYSRRVT